MDRDKDYLLGEPVNYDQDSVKSGRWQKFLDKVHRNGIPWLFENRELFERSIGLMTLWLRSHTSDIRLAKLLYISTEAGPEIFAVN